MILMMNELYYTIDKLMLLIIIFNIVFIYLPDISTIYVICMIVSIKFEINN